MRLIRFEEGAVPIPVTEAEKLELEKTGLMYFDVTENDVEAVFKQNIATKVASRVSEYLFSFFFLFYVFLCMYCACAGDY